MNDDSDGREAQQPPTNAETVRRSVMPHSDDPLVFPGGRTGQRTQADDAPDAVHEVTDEDPAASHEAEDVDAATPPPSRVPRWVLPAVGAGVGLGVIAILVVALGATGPGAPADPSASPSPAAEPTQSTEATFGLLDDGIADDEYPPRAPDRGELFPEAYIMEDWVWAKVGPGWSLAAVGGSYYGDDGELTETAEAFIFLLSPEGKAFELVELPSSFHDFPTVVSWHEDERTARIVSPYGEQAGLVDLTTGELDLLSFRMSSGSSQSVRFVTSLADNTELWAALGDSWRETRVYTWTPTEGWNRILRQQDFYYTGNDTAVSADGARVFFAIYDATDSGFASERSGEPGRPHALVYNLEDRSEYLLKPAYPDGAEACYFRSWHGDKPVVTCWSYDSPGADSTHYAVSPSGALTPISDPYAPGLTNLWDLATFTHDESHVTFVSELNSNRVFELTARVDGVDVVLGTAGQDWPRFGFYPLGMSAVSEHVYRVDTHEGGSYLIDTANGVMTSLLGVQPSAATVSSRAVLVHYGEAALPRDIYWGYYG